MPRSSLRPVCFVTEALRSMSTSRFIPSGVSSNTQEIISVIGNPSATSNSTNLSVHWGASRIGNTVADTSVTTHAAIA